MIVPDANLLLYAYDEASPFHDRAVQWWCRCMSESEPVGLCPVVVFAFIRIGTSTKIFEQPMSIKEATDHVRSWMEIPVTAWIESHETDLEQAFKYLELAGTGGNLTTDAQIAAIGRRYKAIIHTADTDFQRFKGVRWINPIIKA
ncbi:MAG TPA: PIN domain-containing protein [Verrucomicrobiales bacterium]|nr:PIN domain-containing protein [Verrucomicrobiales bacterium]